MDDMLSNQIALQEYAFQVIEAKNNGLKEVNIEDYESLMNAYIDVCRNFMTMCEYLQDSYDRYDELVKEIAPIFNLIFK